MNWNNRYYTREAHIWSSRKIKITNKATDHMHHQILTERTCCTKFIELFDCNNPKVISILAAIENDDLGMGDYFKNALHNLFQWTQ